MMIRLMGEADFTLLAGARWSRMPVHASY